MNIMIFFSDKKIPNWNLFLPKSFFWSLKIIQAKCAKTVHLLLTVVYRFPWVLGYMYPPIPPQWDQHCYNLASKFPGTVKKNPMLINCWENFKIISDCLVKFCFCFLFWKEKTERKERHQIYETTFYDI